MEEGGRGEEKGRGEGREGRWRRGKGVEGDDGEGRGKRKNTCEEIKGE